MMTPSIRTHPGVPALLAPVYPVTQEDRRADLAAVDDEANELLSRNALALLIAMLLDQHTKKN